MNREPGEFERQKNNFFYYSLLRSGRHSLHQLLCLSTFLKRILFYMLEVKHVKNIVVSTQASLFLTG